jgi:hypothetical protein
MSTIVDFKAAFLGVSRALAESPQTDNYTLVLDDANKCVSLSNASAKIITVPPHADVPFLVGTQIPLLADGAGTVSVVAGSGVTIKSFGDLLDLAGQNATACLWQQATDVWVLTGNLA